MKTKIEIENKVKELKKEWVTLCHTSRGTLNQKIKMLEWVLNCEPGVLLLKKQNKNVCKFCNKKFKSVRNDKIFCSDNCKVKYHNKK